MLFFNISAGSKRLIQHVTYAMHELYAKTDCDGTMREKEQPSFNVISISCVTICNYAHTLHCSDKKPFLLEFFRSELDIHTSKRKYMPHEGTKKQKWKTIYKSLKAAPHTLSWQIGRGSSFLCFDDFNHFFFYFMLQRVIMKKSPNKNWSSVVSIFRKNWSLGVNI